MKSVMGWWFCVNNKLPHGDDRKVEIGKTHIIKGEIIPCRNGLHLSTKIMDALSYAKGNIVYRVKGHGEVVPHDGNKFVCSKRTYIAGGINIEQTLRKFARMCALDVINLWPAPDVVVEYLKTGNVGLRGSARHSSWASARASAMDSAMDSAWASATASATASAMDSAWDSAWASARASAMAWASAWNSARASARAWAMDSAWDSARKKQNKRLHKMVMRRIK